MKSSREAPQPFAIELTNARHANALKYCLFCLDYDSIVTFALVANTATQAHDFLRKYRKFARMQRTRDSPNGHTCFKARV